MPRYLRQRDRFSCGPICLLNIVKFQGEKVTYEADYPAWRDFVNCGIFRVKRKSGGISKNGTSVRAFNRVARQLGCRRMRTPNMRKMDKCLANGFALALQVRYNSYHAHFFLITQRRKDALYCVNLYEGETAGWISRKKFYNDNRKHTTEFRVWVVPKDFPCP